MQVSKPAALPDRFRDKHARKQLLASVLKSRTEARLCKNLNLAEEFTSKFDYAPRAILDCAAAYYAKYRQPLGKRAAFELDKYCSEHRLNGDRKAAILALEKDLRKQRPSRAIVDDLTESKLVSTTEREFMKLTELGRPPNVDDIEQTAKRIRAITTELSGKPVVEETTAPLPDFPKAAWRGVFKRYRNAVSGTTEASDVFHFAALWAAAASNLNRNIWMFQGSVVYPNAYIVAFGETGDRKTTAQRFVESNGLLVHPDMRIVRDVGSTEGLADALSIVPDQPAKLTPGEPDNEAELPVTDSMPLGPLYFSFEELSNFLTHARWSGSTLLEFLTQLFDCPPSWSLKYRKQPVTLLQPTPTLFAGTTPSWFWKVAKAEDFFGGFGNRILFLTGSKKAPIPNPEKPDRKQLREIQRAMKRLTRLKPIEAKFSSKAAKVWSAFYLKFESTRRSDLLNAALKRIPTYVVKLAMTYAALENTLPTIHTEQLQAAIAVGEYAAVCAERLLDLRTAVQASSESELEARILKWVRKHPGWKVRNMQMSLSSKYFGSADKFNRVLKSLVDAGRLNREKDGRLFIANTGGITE